MNSREQSIHSIFLIMVAAMIITFVGRRFFIYSEVDRKLLSDNIVSSVDIAPIDTDTFRAIGMEDGKEVNFYRFYDNGDLKTLKVSSDEVKPVAGKESKIIVHKLTYDVIYKNSFKSKVEKEEKETTTIELANTKLKDYGVVKAKEKSDDSLGDIVGLYMLYKIIK